MVVTHYQRLLDYIVPDFVHVLMDGRIVKSGDKELALELEENGYDDFYVYAIDEADPLLPRQQRWIEAAHRRGRQGLCVRRR